MNTHPNPIPEPVWASLIAASLIQLVYAPELGMGFYQWLLKQARAGVSVEIIIGFPHTIRNIGLNPGYYQQLIQAGGRVLIHPEQKVLYPFLLFDNQALLPEKRSSAEGKGFKLEQNSQEVQKIKTLFQQYKESSLMPSASFGPNTGQLGAAPLSTELSMLSLLEKPINIRFYASSAEVGVHQHFELSWEVEGAQKVQIQPLLGLVPPRGSKTFSAEKTVEFELIASNDLQSLSSFVKVAVDASPYIEYQLFAIEQGKQEELLLQADPDRPDSYGVIQGQVLNLCWRVLNADVLQFDGLEVPLVSSLILTPQGLNAYRFVAEGTQGNLSKTIIINAIPRPEIGDIPLHVPESLVLFDPTTSFAAAPGSMKNPLKMIEALPSSNPGVKNISFPSPKPQRIRDFFWFCSGASREILLQCPAFESNKYIGIGATVLFTGLLAALSGAYALYVAFRSLLGAVVFGLIWGSAIFNLDRLIVSSIKKEAGFRKQLTQAIPRLFLALALSLVIAKPMELRIFQPEIEGILSEIKAEKLDRLEQQFLLKIQNIETKIAQIKAETAASFEVRENLYRDYRCECDGTCGTGKIGRGSECERKEAKYQQANREYEDLKAENDALIANLRQEITNVKSQEKFARNELSDRKTDGLVARLSAANRLPFLPSFFIVLLIFIIEITPVFSKLLIDAGPYDKAIQVQSANFDKGQAKILEEHHEQLDQYTELQQRQRAIEADQEIERNQAILKVIAGAQVQLMQDQVKKWLENERNKLRKKD